MIGYDAKNLANSFRTVRKNTIQIAEEIPEDKYDFRPAEGSMTVAEALKHIAVSTNWPIRCHSERLTALTFDMFGEVMAHAAAAQAALQTKADILQALRENGDRFASFLDGLSNDILAETVSFPAATGQASKSRFEMLLSAKEHEMHHRAQLMVAERMLGITPHLTRQMNERVAAFLAQQKQAAHTA
ncbi:MAG: DinB family protein [Ignavibacteriota bacterium]